jgi:hypothetical protein
MEKKIMRQAVGDTLDMNECTIDFDHLAQRKRTVLIYFGIRFA